MKNRYMSLLAWLLAVSPAFADQQLVVPDNGEVQCHIARHGITRLSLVGDAFVSDVRRPTGDGQIDFSIQNEPNRGDLYISVPDAFMGQTITFFATSRKAYTYKFRCVMTDAEAEQVFVENAALAAEKLKATTGASDAWEIPIAIMKAMAAKSSLAGYVTTPAAGRPAYVGSLKVTVVSIYVGYSMVGKTIDVENFGTSAADISEAEMSPVNTVAVSLTKTHLAPHEHAIAYVVLSR